MGGLNTKDPLSRLSTIVDKLSNSRSGGPRPVGSDKYLVFNLHQQSSHRIEPMRGEVESVCKTASANKGEDQIESNQ